MGGLPNHLPRSLPEYKLFADANSFEPIPPVGLSTIQYEPGGIVEFFLYEHSILFLNFPVPEKTSKPPIPGHLKKENSSLILKFKWHISICILHFWQRY